MKKRNRYNKISVKLLFSIFVILVLISATIGIVNYHFAKKELIASGKLDLQHLVNTAVGTLEALNQEVQNGNLTLEEAQEKAREIINGPKVDNGNVVYDYSKTPFVYKKNGYVFALKSNQAVSLNPISKVGSIDTDKKIEKIRTDLISAAKAKNAEDHFYTYSWKNAGDTDAREKISYMTYFEPWDWNIGIGAYTDEFAESLHFMKWLTIILCSSITIISLIIFYFAVRNKFNLLGKLSEVSLEIANGNLQFTKLPETSDELGQLSASFNKMVAEFKEMFEHLQEMSAKLVDSATNLSAISEETSASGEEVGNALAEITNGMVSQASDTEETSRNIELLTKSIEKMNEHHLRMKEITLTSEKASSNGVKMVEMLKKSNEESSKASDEISVGVTNLYNKIQNISNITKTINDISGQTNLLALNASIEAARAGEHGRGFAVVAEEVRKLAEESHQATILIQNMITEIEQETEATVMAMANTVQHSQALNEVVIKTESEFYHINSTVNDTVKAIQSLSEEIENITVKSENINDAIQNIAAVSQQSAASAEEITASVDEQMNALENSTALAEDLNKLSEELNQTIQRFKL